MAKIDGDEFELRDSDAAMIKGMLDRGDAQHHIAAWFGVDSRAVSHVKNGKTHGGVKAVSRTDLPPPGPYRIDDRFSSFYRQMARVDELWQRRRMKDAKALLEASLRSPIITVDRSEIELDADNLLRDEFGILP